MNTFFVTGIGTEVGKTIASAILTQALHADYWKPVQAGDLGNSDTDRIRSLVSDENTHFFPPAYALKHAMSPHAAAAFEEVEIDVDRIRRPQTSKNLVIEGAGGLLVPLNDSSSILDLISPEVQVVLVSRHYLGSINHTLLSYECLTRRNLTCSGIIFNGDPVPSTEQIILKRTNLPMIGRIHEEPFFSRETVSRYAEIFEARLVELGLVSKTGGI